MDKLQENYELALKLGYVDKGSECHITYDGDMHCHYWWNGLEIPEKHVGIVCDDPSTSGRYPWYLQMMKEKGLA